LAVAFFASFDVYFAGGWRPEAAVALPRLMGLFAELGRTEVGMPGGTMHSIVNQPHTELHKRQSQKLHLPLLRPGGASKMFCWSTRLSVK